MFTRNVRSQQLTRANVHFSKHSLSTSSVRQRRQRLHLGGRAASRDDEPGREADGRGGGRDDPRGRHRRRRPDQLRGWVRQHCVMCCHEADRARKGLFLCPLTTIFGAFYSHYQTFLFQQDVVEILQRADCNPVHPFENIIFLIFLPKGICLFVKSKNILSKLF